jgi:hypothetical protein
MFTKIRTKIRNVVEKWLLPFRVGDIVTPVGGTGSMLLPVRQIKKEDGKWWILFDLVQKKWGYDIGFFERVVPR